MKQKLCQDNGFIRGSLTWNWIASSKMNQLFVNGMNQ